MAKLEESLSKAKHPGQEGAGTTAELSPGARDTSLGSKAALGILAAKVLSLHDEFKFASVSVPLLFFQQFADFLAQIQERNHISLPNNHFLHLGNIFTTKLCHRLLVILIFPRLSLRKK